MARDGELQRAQERYIAQRREKLRPERRQQFEKTQAQRYQLADVNPRPDLFHDRRGERD